MLITVSVSMFDFLPPLALLTRLVVDGKILVAQSLSACMRYLSKAGDDVDEADFHSKCGVGVCSSAEEIKSAIAAIMEKVWHSSTFTYLISSCLFFVYLVPVVVFIPAPPSALSHSHNYIISCSLLFLSVCFDIYFSHYRMLPSSMKHAILHSELFEDRSTRLCLGPMALPSTAK
jgi:Glutaminyl-tRNA synthetase, non-specific RNA binding region part 1